MEELEVMEEVLVITTPEVEVEAQVDIQALEVMEETPEPVQMVLEAVEAVAVLLTLVQDTVEVV